MSTANSRLRPREDKQAKKMPARQVEAGPPPFADQIVRELVSLRSLGYRSDEVMICRPDDLSPPWPALTVFVENGMTGKNQLAGR